MMKLISMLIFILLLVTNNAYAVVTYSISGMPIYIEKNKGQIKDSSVEFIAYDKQYKVYFTRTEVRLVSKSTDIKMQWINANPKVIVSGFKPLAGRSHYYSAKTAQPLAHIPHFEGVRYHQIYPGIDMLFYINENHLQYDFIIAASADPNIIEFRFVGDNELMLTNNQLIVRMPDADIIQSQPVIYQLSKNGRQIIEGGYQLTEDQHVKFKVRDYNANLALVIDPKLIFTSAMDNRILTTTTDFAVDASNALYLLGNASNDLGNAVIVAKLSADGRQLDFITHLEGLGNDRGKAIALDKNKAIYITGVTTSEDFPLKNPLQDQLTGENEIFITKISTIGEIAYSTFWGGSADDVPVDIAVSDDGVAYVVGNTKSEDDFPTVNASTAGGKIKAGFNNLFVLSIDSTGSNVIYATTLNGADASGVVVDANHQATIVGTSSNDDFPMLNAWQEKRASKSAEDIVLFRLNSEGKLQYSTFFGGSFYEQASIAQSSDGSVYLGGITESENFPLLKAFSKDTESAIFMAKFNNTGQLVFSSRLGQGDNNSYPAITDIVVGNNGLFTLFGNAHKETIPQVGRSFQSGNAGEADLFVTRFTEDGQRIIYSTYFGTPFYESAQRIALAANNDVFVLYKTRSVNSLALANNVPEENRSRYFISRISAEPAEDYINLSLNFEQTASNSVPDIDNQYQLNLANIGNTSANQVLLEHQVNADFGAKITAATLEGGTCQVDQSASVTCQRDSIADGEKAIATVTVQAKNLGTLIYSANVSAQENEIITKNNQLNHTMEIISADNVADLSVRIISADTVKPWKKLPVTLEIQNNGPAEATGVSINYDFVKEIEGTYFSKSAGTLVSKKADHGTCKRRWYDPRMEMLGWYVECALDNIASGRSTQVHIELIPKKGQYVGHYAYVSHNEMDVNQENNNAHLDLSVASNATAKIRLMVSGKGRVIAENLDCDKFCKQEYAINSSVILVAEAETGWKLKQWSGVCKDKGKTCQVVLFKSTTWLRVSFEKIQ